MTLSVTSRRVDSDSSDLRPITLIIITPTCEIIAAFIGALVGLTLCLFVTGSIGLSCHCVGAAVDSNAAHTDAAGGLTSVSRNILITTSLNMRHTLTDVPYRLTCEY